MPPSQSSHPQKNRHLFGVPFTYQKQQVKETLTPTFEEIIHAERVLTNEQLRVLEKIGKLEDSDIEALHNLDTPDSPSHGGIHFLMWGLGIGVVGTAIIVLIILFTG